MQYTRISGLAAAIILFLLIAVSCALADVDAGTNGNITSAAEEPVSTEIPDNLPAVGYEGYAFTVMTYSPGTYYIEEQTGDIVNDAIYHAI